MIEVMAVVFLAGIVMSGLLVAYMTSWEYWRSTWEMSTISNEGSLALNYIESKLRAAMSVDVKSYSGQPNGLMEITYWRRYGGDIEKKTVEFFYLSRDKTLRMNDFSGTHGVYNKLVLPLMKRNYRREDTPYLRVAEASFVKSTPADPSNQSSLAMITVNLALENTRDDTLRLSTVITGRNSIE